LIPHKKFGQSQLLYFIRAMDSTVHICTKQTLDTLKKLAAGKPSLGLSYLPLM